MCRLVAVAWTSPRGASTTARLVELLAEAASRDPLLEEIAGDGRHCHGYGYFAVVGTADGPLTMWQRFDAADAVDDEERACQANLSSLRSAASQLARIVERSVRGILVLHARRAGRGEPRGTLHAHPYLHGVAARGGYRVYALAHNGSVDKQRLAMLVGVDPSAYTDSNVLAVWLVRQLGYGRSLAEVLEEAKTYTRTALDLAIAEASPVSGGVRAVLHVYGYRVSGMDSARARYYEPLFFDTGDARGYISSTVRMLADERGLGFGEVKTIEGRLVTVELVVGRG